MAEFSHLSACPHSTGLQGQNREVLLMPLLLLVSECMSRQATLLNALPSGNQRMLSQQQQCNASAAAAVHHCSTQCSNYDSLPQVYQAVATVSIQSREED